MVFHKQVLFFIALLDFCICWMICYLDMVLELLQYWLSLPLFNFFVICISRVTPRGHICIVCPSVYVALCVCQPASVEDTYSLEHTDVFLTTSSSQTYMTFVLNKESLHEKKKQWQGNVCKFSLRYCSFLCGNSIVMPLLLYSWGLKFVHINRYSGCENPYYKYASVWSASSYR